MSTAVTSRWLKIPRIGLPIVIALLLAGFAALWAGPGDELPRAPRVMASMPILALSCLLALIWILFFSGVWWPLRLLVPAAIVGGAYWSVDNVEFDGDMAPTNVHFRWQPTPEQIREAFTQVHDPDKTVDVKPPSGDPGPEDYPEFRNRARDGIAHGPTLARDWKTKQPRLIWRHPCGGGYAGMAVGAGRAVTIEQRGDKEAVVCYDPASGRELWSHSYVARFYDARGGEGPMATPTIAGGRVYSLGGTGRLVCLDLTNGDLKWGHDILQDNDNITWGMAGSPLVFDKVVVVNPGEQRTPKQQRAVVAYDRDTGAKVWSAGDTMAGYSSPMLATIAGVRQIVLFDGAEIAGYDPAGAGKLWSFPWRTNYDINVAQPVLLSDDGIFVSSGYGVGCGRIDVTKKDDKWSAAQKWHTLAMQCKFTSPVLYKGLVYGLNDGAALVCVDPADGRKVWSGPRCGHGQLLLSNDLLLIQCENGELALVEAAGEKSKELGRFPALAREKTWNSPCLAEGFAYVRNHREMACYDLRDGE